MCVFCFIQRALTRSPTEYAAACTEHAAAAPERPDGSIDMCVFFSFLKLEFSRSQSSCPNLSLKIHYGESPNIENCRGVTQAEKYTTRKKSDAAAARTEQAATTSEPTKTRSL